MLLGTMLATQLFSVIASGGDAQISQELLKSSAAEMDVILIYNDNDNASSQSQRDEKVRAFGGRNFRHFQNSGIGALTANRPLLDELKKDSKIRFIAPDRKISSTASGSSTYDQIEVRTVLGVSSSTPGFRS